RGAEVQRANAKRIPRMAARHVRRQARVFTPHFRSGDPRRIHLLGGHGGDALPAAVWPGNGNRIADGFAATVDPVESPVTEADDDLARSIACRERNHLARATAPKEREKAL